MTPAKLQRQARRIATSTRKRQSIRTLLSGLRRYLRPGGAKSSAKEVKP